MLYEEVRFLPAGEAALVVEFADTISLEANARVQALAAALGLRSLPGLGEAIPTYRSLLVNYDPLVLEEARLQRHLAALLKDAQPHEAGEAPPDVAGKARPREIPTAYGGEMGPDLPSVAASAGLTEDEVIRLHGETIYTVYMVGFLPGFPYMGTLPEALTTARLEAPRVAVPAGSVAIAGRQTGIYPMESPGGWRIIGRTPLRLFDPYRDPPAYIAPGDRVRFVPVAAEELPRLAEEQVWS